MTKEALAARRSGLRAAARQARRAARAWKLYASDARSMAGAQQNLAAAVACEAVARWCERQERRHAIRQGKESADGRE